MTPLLGCVPVFEIFIKPMFITQPNLSLASNLSPIRLKTFYVGLVKERIFFNKKLCEKALEVEFRIFKINLFYSLIEYGKTEYLKVSVLQWCIAKSFESRVFYWETFIGISSMWKIICFKVVKTRQSSEPSSRF